MESQIHIHWTSKIIWWGVEQQTDTIGVITALLIHQCSAIKYTLGGKTSCRWHSVVHSNIYKRNRYTNWFNQNKQKTKWLKAHQPKHLNLS